MSTFAFSCFERKSEISTRDIKRGFCFCCKEERFGVENRTFACKFCDYSFGISICGECERNLYNKTISITEAVKHEKEHQSVDLV